MLHQDNTSQVLTNLQRISDDILLAFQREDGAHLFELFEERDKLWDVLVGLELAPEHRDLIEQLEASTQQIIENTQNTKNEIHNLLQQIRNGRKYKSKYPTQP